MQLRAGVATSVGLVRQTNEDSYLVRQGLYVICDGMGGARGGEVASAMACHGLAEIDPVQLDAAALLAAVKDINRLIVDRSMRDTRLFGMGTTLTAALAGDEKMDIVHVGDSRAYLMHDGELRQLTDDHSWVGEMIRRGELTLAQAAVHPHRSVITKVLGTEPEIEPDLLEVAVVTGDRLLLCTDGLSGMVADADLVQIMQMSEVPQTVADSLVRAALAAGGEDNVTAIVIDVGAAVDADPEASDRGGDDTIEDDASSTAVLVGPQDRRPPAGSRGASATLKGVRAAARSRLAGWAPAGTQRETHAEAGAAREIKQILGSPGAELSAAPAGSSRPRSRQHRWLIVAVIVVVVLALALGGFAAFNSSVYYVGTYGGNVALYNGLPGTVLGMELSSVIEQGTAVYDALPPYVQERIDAHELTSREEGQNYLRSLNAWQ